MNTQQRAAIAAELANLGRGGDRGNQHTGGKPSNDSLADTPPVTIAEAAELPELDIDLSGFECDKLPDLVIEIPEIVIDFDPEAFV